MITVFTTPKPFVGRIREIQVNALKSWKLLHPDIEVIIFGDEEGTLDVANNLGLVHIPDVETNECGLPLVNSMFELAQQYGRYEIQSYVNADIVLLNDFIHAVSRISFKRFLMVGQRWDLDLCEPIDFDSNDWHKDLIKKVQREAMSHPRAGSDYFVFVRGTLKDIPPLVVGKPGWDTWLIYHARASRIPVIDCSPVTTIIHQNHTQAYGSPHPGPDCDLLSQRNIEIAGGWEHVFTLWDADWLLTPDGLKRNRSRAHLIRAIETYSVLHPGGKWLGVLAKSLSFFLGLMRNARSSIQRYLENRKKRLALKNIISQSNNRLFITIGASNTAQIGWINTDEDVLDITKEADWKRYFSPSTIDGLLAEHVFEHISENECLKTLQLCYKYLKPGCRLRIAVPDGYSRNLEYIASISPPKEGHKQLFNVDSLSRLLVSAGFRVHPMEYFDDTGLFHYCDWDTRDGKVMRSRRFDPRNQHGSLVYTSLIIDGIKE